MSTTMGFSTLVQCFFTRHLTQHKQVSPRTITAYRDTVIENRIGRPPSDLDITDLDSPTILAFLDHLEAHRSNHARSRNVRLSAIRSFFRFASVRDVDNLAVASRVLAIPNKRSARPMMTFLSRPEIDAVLATTDQTTWMGSRDHALLLTMYNTGARGAEITTLRCGQLSFGRTTLIRLHGKGRKDRAVLWSAKTSSEPIIAWRQRLCRLCDAFAHVESFSTC
jgi:integrase/recombinase XerD